MSFIIAHSGPCIVIFLLFFFLCISLSSFFAPRGKSRRGGTWQIAVLWVGEQSAPRAAKCGGACQCHIPPTSRSGLVRERDGENRSKEQGNTAHQTDAMSQTGR
uniref:Uncharacterized protein n=1 Tax=Trypanosoma congolense (strain IL3000) TaxID=1068625 RepID=G0UQD2_TRYCI|nr:hypothetical protein, unlikely [Trypanosoma congolense IL3000]